MTTKAEFIFSLSSYPPVVVIGVAVFVVVKVCVCVCVQSCYHTFKVCVRTNTDPQKIRYEPHPNVDGLFVSAADEFVRSRVCVGWQANQEQSIIHEQQQ